MPAKISRSYLQVQNRQSMSICWKFRRRCCCISSLGEIVNIILCPGGIGQRHAFSRYIRHSMRCFLAVVDSGYKRVIIALLNTALAIPAVFIGLMVYILVTRRGLLGIPGPVSPGSHILGQHPGVPISPTLFSGTKKECQEPKTCAITGSLSLAMPLP